MSSSPPVIGIDFGTTNSVVALLQRDGSVRTLRAAGLDVFRTVLCFWIERGSLRHAAGPHAVAAYLDDPEAMRLIMSMKTYLAQRSFSSTQVMGRRFTLEALVALFLRGLLADHASACGGLDGVRIVAGRPVRFAGELADDALGEARLRASFREAGLGEVEVAFEPEAAGFRFTRALAGPATVLIGDFGGGTSDFSLLRFDSGAARAVTPLATTGVGVAGDSFDARIMDRVVAPYLGKDGTYRVMGKDMPVPAEYYAGLSRWHRLSLMRTPRTLREIADVARTAAEPERLRRLSEVIEDELGYQLYQSVSAAKAELSRADRALLRFHHGSLHIEQWIERDAFEGWIAPELAALSAAVNRVLAMAALPPGAVDRVFLTGGGEFVSVAEGLALIGRERLGL